MKQDKRKTTILAQSIGLIIILGLSVQPVFAMQALDDASMGHVTGEGIAFAVSDFNVRFNGADDGVGTGYTHLIPVGPLSDTIAAHNAAIACVNNSSTCTDAQKSRARYNIQIGKGDVYLYGLSISGNDGDITTQFNNDESTNKVNIGTGDNPWLFQTRTVTTPSFSGVDSPLTYLGFEAPLLSNYLDANNYNLKVGMWADAFVRDPSKIEGDAAQFQLNGATRNLSPTDTTQVTRENRLRLQAIMNGVGLNGTNLKIFQTLNGAESAAGLGGSYSHYNNTLGLALTARINSGDSSDTTFRVGYSDETTTGSKIDVNNSWNTWKTIHTGENASFDSTGIGGAVGASCGNSGGTNSSFGTGTGCQYQIQTRSRTDTKSLTRTWTMPSGLNDHVVRLSTRETTDSPDSNQLLYTPALNANAAPTFDSNEGLFLYKPNINLVLGTQWQPIVMGVADDGKNLSLELTRIPNVEAVYKQIYTDYSGADSSYKGGTCSIYWCGGDGNGISKNATHSSITIGSTVKTAATSTVPLQLIAYTGTDAIGVSFGALGGTSQTASTSAVVSELRYKQRQLMPSNTWQSAYWCSSVVIGCWGYSSGTGTLYQWQYTNNGTSWTTGATAVTKPTDVTCSGTGCNTSSPSVSYDGYTYPACPLKADCTRYGTNSNRSWASNTTDASWLTASKPTVDSFVGGANAGYGQTGTTYSSATNFAETPTISNTTPLNNLGSAAIDGLLIQHLKLSTKGL